MSVLTPQRREWIGALVVGLGSFLWLRLTSVEAGVTPDSVRDFLLARDCVELGQCHLVGASASVSGVAQGAVWIDLVSLVRLLGGGAAMTHTVVLGLLSVGLATLFLVSRRWIHPAVAVPAVLLALAVLDRGRVVATLINPSAAFFPDVLTAAALLLYGLTARLPYLAVAALACSLAIDTHVSSVCLAPPVLMVAWLGAQRPARALGLAAAVLLGTSFITSRGAVLANLVGLLDHPGLIGVATAGLVGTAIVAVFLRRSFQASPARRVPIIGLVLIAPFCAAAAWLALIAHHELRITYWHPVIGPGAVLASAALVWPVRSWLRSEHALRRVLAHGLPIAGAAGVLVSTSIPAATAQRETGWTYSDAARLAPTLERQGWTYPQLALHIEGRDCTSLMMGLAAYMSPPPRDRFDPMRALSIEKVTRPGNREGLPIQLDDGFALLRETRSWVDSSFVRSCRRSAEGTECADLLAEPSTTVSATDFLFSEWMLPRPHVFQPVIADAASFELRLTPEAGATRQFELYDDTPGCGWQFDRAEGLETSTLPARSIQVRSIAGAPARLTMTRQRSPGCAPPDDPFPACYREAAVESTRPLARTAP